MNVTPAHLLIEISIFFSQIDRKARVFVIRRTREIKNFNQSVSGSTYLISGPVALATLLFVELVEVESQGVTILVFIFIAGELGLCTRVFAIF